jgi:hypothetical protein
MTQPLNEGRFVKVPVPGDLQRGQNLKVPTRPPANPAPAQTTQSGGGSNGSK